MTATEEELKQVLSGLSELSSLKTIAASPASSKDLLVKSAPLFATLKCINRSTHLDTQDQKDRVEKERKKVETARIALQNLKYEESKLEQLVRSYQESQSTYQNIPLHSLEEFKAARAESNVPADPHALMLARLEFELSERTRLEEDKLSRQQERNDLVKDNKHKKVKLEHIERSLKDLSAAANSIQTRLETF